MDKIAAYEVALRELELEKRASQIVDEFGTCQGDMPTPYLVAFDQLLRKEANISALGRGLASIGEGVGGLASRAGSALSSSGGAAGGVRQTLGSALTRAGQGIAGNSDAAALLGAGTVGAAGLGLGVFGTGAIAGRMTAPRAPRA